MNSNLFHTNSGLILAFAFCMPGLLVLPGSWACSVCVCVWVCVCVCVCARVCTHTHSVAQWCPTLCNSTDYSLPGSSVFGIFQARILEWVAISYTGCVPHPGIKSVCLLPWQADSLPLAPPGNLSGSIQSLNALPSSPWAFRQGNFLWHHH